MRKGNFNMADKGMTTHSIPHNTRNENKPAHNIITNPEIIEKNEAWQHPIYNVLTKETRTEIIDIAGKIVKEKIGQSMQATSKKSFFKEAVLNLEGHHTTKNVLAVVDKINENLSKKNKPNITPLRIDIHKDEGHFIDENGIDFYHGADIFPGRGDDKDNFYLDTERTRKIDMKKLAFIPNYHAHLIYTNFDFELGKTARPGKADIQYQHQAAAEVLKLDPPTSNADKKKNNEPTQGLNTKQLREYYAERRDERIIKLGFDPATYEPGQNTDNTAQDQQSAAELQDEIDAPS